MIRDDFGLSYTRCALVTSVFSLAYGFGQRPVGWLSDRVGPRLLITVGILGVGFGDLFFINGLGMGILLLFIGFNSFVRMPVSEAYIMEQAHAHRRSKESTFIFLSIVSAFGHLDWWPFQQWFQHELIDR